MNLSEIDLQELFQELKKNSNLEKIQHNISRIFQSNKRELFEFSIFLFKNNLLCLSEKLMLFLVLYQISREFPYENHIALIMRIAIDNDDYNFILFIKDLVIDKNIAKYVEVKSEEILSQADKLQTQNKSIKDTKNQIQDFIKIFYYDCPDVQCENFLLSTVFNDQEPILDNFQMRQEFILRKDSIFKIKNFCIHEPQFLLPEPEEIPCEFDQLMTPFPLFVETPVINSCIDAEKLIEELFQNVGDLDEQQQAMLVNLLENNLNGVKKDYLFENMQKLIHINTELVARIGTIIHQQNQTMFNEYLDYFQEKGDFTLNYLETMYNLLKTCKISQEFLDKFIQSWFNHCKSVEGKNQAKKLKLICRLVAELIKKNLFNPSHSLEVWVHINMHFKSDKFVSDMYKLIQQRLKQESKNQPQSNQL